MKASNTPQDEFLKSLFHQVEIKEELSITEKVMQQIQEVPTPEPITYQPPIGAKAWALIASGIALIVVLSLLMEGSFAVDPSQYYTSVTGWFNGIGSKLSFGFTLPELPSISGPYLTAIFAFNIIGVYFAFTYWSTKRA